MRFIEKKRFYNDEQKLVINKIVDTYKLDEFVASLVAERVKFEFDEVDYFLSDTFTPINPFGLKGMKEAVELTYDHMSKNNHIFVLNDFDFDGNSCSYAFTHLFKAFCYKNVKIQMPHRQKESYGLSVAHIEMARELGSKLIITGDNGISAFDAIDKAREYNIDVIVTDHHEVIMDESGVPKIPNATVIVNPHQPGCTYKYKMLAGAGVVYKFCQAMIMCAPKEIKQNFLTGGYKEKIISIAGLAAIADVMELTGENRALVKQAFKYLEKGCIPAVYSIMPSPSVYSVAFTLAPRLSSVSRLNDMMESLDFLCEEDPEKILIKKEKIESYNTKRKEMQEEGLVKVNEKLSKYKTFPKVIVEVVENLPETLIGLIAGKVKEQYGVPTIIFSNTNKGDFKGSGRSIEEYSMFQQISPFLDKNKVYGGGHPMACGLRATSYEAIDEFREYLLNKCTLTDEDLVPKIYIDKYISIRDNLMKLYEDIKVLEPFGTQNPSPVFAIADAKIQFTYKTYKGGEFANVIISDDKGDDFYVEGVCWDSSIYLRDNKKIFDVVTADIIVVLELNKYSKKVQLNIKNINFK